MVTTFDYNGETFEYYTPEDIPDILNKIPRDTCSKKKIQYYNVASAFDIETSSIIKNDEKIGFMYMWSFAIEDFVIVGRTWKEFIEVCGKISDSMVTYKRRKFVIYVHNLAYEFQFLRTLFKWEKVFNLDRRKPILAITTTGIEFRCSYVLSGYSLANLPTKKYKKLVGALDYSLIRHNTTPITNEEMAYSIRDVQTVVEYIQDKLVTDGNITKIPMTKTGYVRVECRKSCFGEGKHDKQFEEYHKMIEKLTIFPEEYHMLKDAFQGGFTHANAFHVHRCERGINGKHYLEGVGSFDITSDYPAEMVCESGYPMGKGQYFSEPTQEIVDESLKNYFCVIDITLYDLEDIVHIDNPISESRCTEKPPKVKNSKFLTNNGRVVNAEFIRITLTNIDFDIVKACYSFSHIKVHRLIRYKRGYLPTPFIKKVLEFYAAKTKLKGETGEENERKYLWGKENVNATFGCTVTDICQPLIEYSPETEQIYTVSEIDTEETLKKYNKQMNRFLYYPWGVAITAYARRRLWGVILACGWDYVYSDTDSVKILNPEKHLDIFKKSDEIITKKLKAAVKYHGLKWEDVAPKNNKGEPKQLGLWEYEHKYDKFKTCGAKRYMCAYDKALDVKENGKTVYYDLTLTVSGLNKRTAIPYLMKKYKTIDNVFKNFSQGLTVPPPYSGRAVSYYIDDAKKTQIYDYLGNSQTIKESTGIVLENTSYTMDYNEKYEQYTAYIYDWCGVHDAQHTLQRRLSIE